MKHHNELMKLREKILMFNEAYENGSPLVNDIVYDFYKKKLALLEQHEKIKISEYVGAPRSHVTSPHLFSVLSLDHDFGASSIEKFIKKIEKLTDPFPMVAELKIDGVSVIARYENGNIKTLKTRGNGKLGEDISHLIPFLKLPDKIYLQEKLEIRFEAYFDKDIVKNPRNAAAGTLLKKEPDPKLIFMKLAPHFLYSDSHIWSSYSQLRSIFYNMHLSCIEPFSVCVSLEECIQFYKYIEKNKDNFSHEIDGVVFKVSSKEKQDILGDTAKAPRSAFAIKFSNPFNITEILDIEFHVGRQGSLTPLAIIAPTKINDRTITKATLNNINDLKQKKYSIGDIIKVEMAGEVIPKITDIIEKSENETVIPCKCPSCGTILKEDFCPANWECPEQKLNKLIYFASKPCLNIKTIGKTQIEFFVKEKLLNYPYDFFELKNTIKRVMNKPNWLAEKSFAKIVESIEKSKYMPLDQFITSLGLPNIAKTKANEIAQHFKIFESFINCRESDLEFLGENNARYVYEYLEQEKAWIIATFNYMKIGQTYKKYSLFDL